MEPLVDLTLAVLGLSPPIDKHPPSASTSRPLVKDRPSTLEQNYLRLESEEQISQSLEVFREHFLSQFDKRRPLIPEIVRVQAFREYGRLTDGRPYFYFQKPNELGFLVEPHEDSWLIFQAHKDKARGKFIRSSQIWDQLGVYINTSTKSENSSVQQIRVDSQRFTLTKASLLTLERKLVEACLM